MKIYELLMNDHRMVLEILDAIERTDDPGQRKSLITFAHTELAMHSKSEEEVFYRPLRDKMKDNSLIHNSFDDHDKIDALLAKLQATPAKGKEWLNDMRELRATIAKHVKKEEGPLFDAAREIFSAAQADKIGIEFMAEKGKLGLPNPITVAARKIKKIVSGD